MREAALLRLNRMLRERVEELEETVRQLIAKDELAGLPDDLPPLTGKQEAIMRLLIKRRTVTKLDVYFALYGDREDRKLKTVDVWLHLLRQRLAGTRYRIATIWGGELRLETQATASVSPTIHISHPYPAENGASWLRIA